MPLSKNLSLFLKLYLKKLESLSWHVTLFFNFLRYAHNYNDIMSASNQEYCNYWPMLCKHFFFLISQLLIKIYGGKFKCIFFKHFHHFYFNFLRETSLKDPKFTIKTMFYRLVKLVWKSSSKPTLKFPLSIAHKHFNKTATLH